MPLDLQTFRSLSPEELRRRYSMDELQKFRDQLANQLQTPTGAPAIDTESSGVDFLDRAKVSFAGTDEGRANMLRQSGYEPMRLPDGSVGVRGKDGVVRPIDPKGMDLGDLADFAGEVPATALSILGGLAGAGAGGGIASLATGAAGAAAGAGAGEGIRQSIGQYLGSGEDFRPGQMASEAALGAMGEGAGRVVAGGLKLAAAPFKKGLTQRIGNVAKTAGELDATLGTNLERRLPVSARTESGLLGSIEQRVAESPVTGDQFRRQVGEPFRSETITAFDRLAARMGNQTGTEATGEAVRNAAAKTLEARKAFVDQAYNDLRQQLGKGVPAYPLETQKALLAAAERTGTSDLVDFEAAKPLRDTIAKLLNDTDKITTFEQLDAFRKLVGNMMSSRGASEEFARVGFDAHLGSIYRALLADSEAVLASGGAQGAAQKATAAARNLFELDRASISNLLRDPDKAAQVVDRLTAKNTTPAQVRTFAQKIGAQPTSSGLPATAEGKAAWQQLSAEVMAKLRTEAINPNTTRQGAEVLSGQRLVSALQRMDGTGGVLREILGKQQADYLFKYAYFLRDASSAERMFANTSRTGMHNEALSYASAPQRGLTGILGAIGQYAGTKAVGRATMTPGGQKYLTQGVLQSPGAQTALGALGRLAPQMLALPYNNRQQGRR